jgi:hypothetical protein
MMLFLSLSLLPPSEIKCLSLLPPTFSLCFYSFAVLPISLSLFGFKWFDEKLLLYEG